MHVDFGRRNRFGLPTNYWDKHVRWRLACRAIDMIIGDGNEDSKGSYSAYDGCSELWREHS